MTYTIMSGVLNSTGKPVWAKAPLGTDISLMVWKDSEGHIIDHSGDCIKHLKSWEVEE